MRSNDSRKATEAKTGEPAGEASPIPERVRGRPRALAAAACAAFGALLWLAITLVRRRRRRRLPARAVIVSPRRSTVVFGDGAVRSVQSAQLTIPRADLERLWNPTNLENLARTYWHFLSTVTCGLVRVLYSEDARSVVLLGRPLTLLRFDAPEYALDRGGGRVIWKIRDGLLVARHGHGCGRLALDVRLSDIDQTSASVLIEVEVSNFYPAIAAFFSVPVYEATQSVVHVLVTHAFLRSLAKLELAESKVGALAGLQWSPEWGLVPNATKPAATKPSTPAPAASDQP
jgi:hypothetical protein